MHVAVDHYCCSSGFEVPQHDSYDIVIRIFVTDEELGVLVCWFDNILKAFACVLPNSFFSLKEVCLSWTMTLRLLAMEIFVNKEK